jgi:hypothetical protein
VIGWSKRMVRSAGIVAQGEKAVKPALRVHYSPACCVASTDKNEESADDLSLQPGEWMRVVEGNGFRYAFSSPLI